MKNSRWLVPILAIVPLFLAAPSLAGGSLMLSDLRELLNQSETLTQEVERSLTNRQRNLEEVVCWGVRLGRHLEPLAGARVAPFRCKFAPNAFLTIEAQNWVILEEGQAIDLDVFLELDPRPSQATVEFRLKSWRWETK